MNILKLTVSIIWMFSIVLSNSDAKTLRVINFSSDVPGITSLGKTFDPDSYSVSTQLFDSLVHIDLDGKIVPALATSWKLINDTTYEFTLRRNVSFHNGEKFTSAAVKFTYDAVLDPKNQTGNAWIMGTIKRVEVMDSHKVRIHLKHPDGMFIFRLSMFGAIAPPGYIGKVGLEGFFQKPIGTGPFKFVSWESGKEIVLEKNTGYWEKGTPKVEKLIFKIVPEKNWASALLSNKVDVITNIPRGAIKAVEKSPNFQIMKREVLQGYWVLLSDKGVLKDIRIRQALNYAVDKKKMIRAQAGGLGTPLASLGKSGEIGKNKKLKPYPLDISKAKSLLQQSGHSNITLTNLAILPAKPLVQSITQDLKKIGITVKTTFVSRPEWAKQVVVGKITGKPYQGDMAINLVDNPIMDLAFHAGLFLASPSPWSLISDPTYDGMFQKALFKSKLAEHTAALEELDRYIHDNAMMLFTFQPVRMFGVSNRVKLPSIGINGHVDYYIFSKAQ